MKNNLQSKPATLPLLVTAALALTLLSSCSSQMGCPGSIVNGMRRHGHYSSTSSHSVGQPTSKTNVANSIYATNQRVNNTINF